MRSYMLIVLCSCLSLIWSESIHDAVRDKQPKRVLRMIRADPNRLQDTNDDGYLPIHIAAREGRNYIISELAHDTSIPVDFDTPTPDGLSPAELARKRGHVTTATIIETAHLMRTIRDGKTKQARSILKKNPDTATQYIKDIQPIHVAAQHNQRYIITSLIEYGADGNARTKDVKTTPLHMATDPSVIMSLIRHGAHVDARDSRNYTPLHEAAHHADNEKSLEYMIQAGADVNAHNRRNETPLHFAAMRGKKALVKLLITNAAEVSVQNVDGDTPLHLTSDPAVAQILINAGADTSVTNDNGETPLDIARNLSNDMMDRKAQRLKRILEKA